MPFAFSQSIGRSPLLAYTMYSQSFLKRPGWFLEMPLSHTISMICPGVLVFTVELALISPSF